MFLGTQLPTRKVALKNHHRKTLLYKNQQQQDLWPELLTDRKLNCLQLSRTSTKIVGICRKLEQGLGECSDSVMMNERIYGMEERGRSMRVSLVFCFYNYCINTRGMDDEERENFCRRVSSFFECQIKFFWVRIFMNRGFDFDFFEQAFYFL
jgi:hypothetical protein